MGRVLATWHFHDSFRKTLVSDQKLDFFGYGRVLWTFSRKTRATLTINFFKSVFYKRENFIPYLEINALRVFETKWWAFENIILYGNRRVLYAFHRNIRATRTMKLIKNVLYMGERVFSTFELPYIFWRMNVGRSKTWLGTVMDVLSALFTGQREHQYQ